MSSDRDKNLPAHFRTEMPNRVPLDNNNTSYRNTHPMPNLPSASGAFFGSRTRICKKDTEFVRAHTDFLTARKAQTQAFTGLVEARIELAYRLTDLNNIDSLCGDAYEVGRMQREHQKRMLMLSSEVDETRAHAALIDARRLLEPYAQQSTPVIEHQLAVPAPAANLSHQDVLAALQNMPDVPDAAKETIARVIAGTAKEKRRA